MILAEKIIEERKKMGWSQEELADKLGVSRQSVSKWESAGSVPDLQRLLQMAEIFGVSTDYLLKDDLENDPSHSVLSENVVPVEPIRRVSMEEANAFLNMKKKGAPIVANATALCIISPVLVIILAAMAEGNIYGVSEGLATGVGCTFLFIAVAVAVFMFITFGIEESRMEHLERDIFETEYGVAGMVRERKKNYEQIFAKGIAIGVVLCIISVIPVIIAGAIGAEDYVCAILVGVLLLFIAVGVNMIIRVSMVKSSYDTLLQEGEYSIEEKRTNSKLYALSGVYWSVITAGYLAWSFITWRWDFTWIVWPVAGVLFAAISGIAKVIVTRRD